MGGLTAAAILLGAAALWLGALLIRQGGRIRRLARQMENFLSRGERALDFSVREDGMAPLHNAAAEMENQLLLARERQRRECRRTADLLADISHQLKTPLAALRLFCEMDQGPHAAQEMEQADRMERLISSLLRLERLCADGYDFHFEQLYASALVREAWRTLRPLYPEKRLTLEGDALLRCDGKWMGEAFLNLLKNACEHTRRDGRIRVRLESGEGAFFGWVEDDGGGAAARDLPHLFERFYRAQGQETQGAGIGLSMVREIVRHHQGQVQARNTEEGLCVMICIPHLQRQMAASATV